MPTNIPPLTARSSPEYSIKVKRMAAERGLTVSKFIRDAIDAYIQHVEPTESAVEPATERAADQTVIPRKMESLRKRPAIVRPQGYRG